MTQGDQLAPGASRVALTFDAEHPDRPAARDNAERLVEGLGAAGVRATFFLQGRWVEAYPETARRIAAAGHLVGNHSFYHARMHLLTPRGLEHDIDRAEAAIIDATGVDPRPWFRCPFGAGARHSRVLRAIDAAGYRHVGWTVDPQDWDRARPGEDMVALILEQVRGTSDAIVLLHSWPDRTVASIRAMASRLRAAGCELVGVDELEQVAAAPADAVRPS